MMATRQIRREIDAGLLVALPVPVQHEPRRIGVMQRTDLLPTPALRSLLDALAEVAEKIDE